MQMNRTVIQLPTLLSDYQDGKDIKGSPVILSPNATAELPIPIQPSIIYMEAALPTQLQSLSITKLSLDYSLDARLRNVLPPPPFIRSRSSSNSLASATSATSSSTDDESCKTLDSISSGYRATSIPLLLNPIEDRQHPHQQQQPDNSKQYHCTFCQKKFMRPSSLKIHIYSHTGEKPFNCSYSGCRRRFSVQSNMRRHLRVHFS